MKQKECEEKVKGMSTMIEFSLLSKSLLNSELLLVRSTCVTSKLIESDWSNCS